MKHKYKYIITFDSGHGNETRIEELTEDELSRYERIMNRQRGVAYKHQTKILDIHKL